MKKAPHKEGREVWMDQKNNRPSVEGKGVASPHYTARKKDMCVLPVKNDILCPHCTDKFWCRKPTPESVQVLSQETQ